MRNVLIVGAGPVGLVLALDLARRGVACRIIDKATERSFYCRAIGVTPRSLEVFEDLGVVQPIIEAGLWIEGMRSVIAGKPPHDMMLPPLGLPYAQLGVPQYETERVLTEALAARGAVIDRGVELVGLEQDDDGVEVQLRNATGAESRERYAYVVGCDGAHSAVRRAIGANFDGDAYPWSFMLGDTHIEWDLPYGMSLRALHLNENAPPDMFIAIPLPERGRYRVSMLAPPSLSGGATGHGIQAEMPGPSLDDLQAIADALLPGKARLSDLRWSSIFRISMRLADRYRDRRVFIAGDAAHIHPPTGGQGMNTGIQDSYNLPWKLALAIEAAAAPSLLDSYEIERRPVGADVVARTRAASESYGQEHGRREDSLLVDAQVLVGYRASPIVRDTLGPGVAGPQAGDRAPDVAGLERQGLAVPVRLFEILRGTGHVVLVRSQEAGLEGLAGELRANDIRVVVVTDGEPRQRPGLIVLRDRNSAFDQAYGVARAFVIRPDGYIGWRGSSWQEEGLQRYFTQRGEVPSSARR